MTQVENLSKINKLCNDDIPQSNLR